MRKITGAVAVWLLYGSLAFGQFQAAQLDIEATSRKAIVNTGKAVVREGYILIGNAANPVVKNVGFIDIKTPMKSFAFQASDEKRNVVEIQQATDTQLIVFRTGKTWVTIYGTTAEDKPIISTVIVDVAGSDTTPDDPDIEPDEPDVKPDPDIPSDSGFRVLMIRETGELLPQAQQAIFASGVIRNYLNANTVKDGAQPEWRIFDKDMEIYDQSSVWFRWMQRPRNQIPWVIISNGQQGYEGPLPADVPSMLELLKKYGG